MQKGNFVVSANYMDRNSPDRWRMRTWVETPEESKAFPFLVAENVRFVCSIGYPEDSWGCRALALCDGATGYTNKPEDFSTENMVPLKYMGTYFTGKDNDMVYSVEKLYLDQDGHIYAVNPVYEDAVIVEEQ